MMLASLSAPVCAQKRPFTPDDLFRLEEIGVGFAPPIFSPDGRWLAYGQTRPLSLATNVMALRNDNADIWTVATGGGEPVNITKGAMDGASFFFPVWSPDSERLAMLSTRGGGIRLWVWERPAHRLVQVMDREISSTNPPIWLSDREVACVVVPKGESDILSLRQAAEVPMREWPKAWQGKESTANVLDSGTPSDYKKRPKGALVYVDVIKYSDRVVAEGDFSSMTLSPDSRYVAMLEKVHVIARDPNTLVESPVS